MSAAVSCPHCGAASPDLDRTLGPRPIVDCPACDRSFIAVADDGPDAAAVTPASGAGAAPEAQRHPTDIALLPSGAAGALATLAIHRLLVPALGSSMLGELLGKRGWVPIAITFLAMWSLAILAAKVWRIREQRAGRALLEGVLAGEAAIDRAEAAQLGAKLEQLRQRYPRSLWLARLGSALAHYQARGRVSAVTEHRALAAQADVQAVEGSYSLLRVFIWAIPILGFIGTVIGIGAAVAGFSDSVAVAVDLEVMKSSIGTVTNGLGVAFDTTLLALVVSLLLMIPTSALQKSEEDWIAEIDAVCDEHLVRRMRESSDADGAGAPSIAALAEQIARLADAIDRQNERTS